MTESTRCITSTTFGCEARDYFDELDILIADGTTLSWVLLFPCLFRAVLKSELCIQHSSLVPTRNNENLDLNHRVGVIV